jgi:hypothetical protein
MLDETWLVVRVPTKVFNQESAESRPVSADFLVEST